MSARTSNTETQSASIPLPFCVWRRRSNDLLLSVLNQQYLLNGKLLFGDLPKVSDHLVDLPLRQFVLERWHRSHSVRDDVRQVRICVSNGH